MKREDMLEAALAFAFTALVIVAILVAFVIL